MSKVKSELKVWMWRVAWSATSVIRRASRLPQGSVLEPIMFLLYTADLFRPIVCNHNSTLTTLTFVELVLFERSQSKEVGTHQRWCRVNAFKPTSAEYWQGRGALVHFSSMIASGFSDSVRCWLRCRHTMYHQCDTCWLWSVDENSHFEDCVYCCDTLRSSSASIESHSESRFVVSFLATAFFLVQRLNTSLVNCSSTLLRPCKVP